MAQTVSDEELQAKQAELAKLREKVATEESKAATRAREQENAIQFAQLEAEQARLELQLHNAKEAAKVTTVKQGVEPLVASAKEQMRAAAEQLKAAQGGESPGAPKDPTPEELAASQETVAAAATVAASEATPTAPTKPTPPKADADKDKE